MDMKRILTLVMVVAFVAAAVGMVTAADKSKVYFVCNCKDDCNCDSLSKDPGKCKCGSDMAAMHLLAVEKGTAVLCRCGADCTCERSKTDPEKCGCGKPVKKVGLKGKYVCGCGDACQCGAISDKPGKCGCGKEMKQL